MSHMSSEEIQRAKERESYLEALSTIRRKKEEKDFLTRKKIFFAGAIIACVGGLIMAIGPFMSFACGLGIISVSGIASIVKNLAGFIIACGCLSIIFGIIGLSLNKNFSLMYILFSLIGIALTYICHRQILNQIGEDKIGVSIGEGIWMCYIGAAFLFISAFLSSGEKSENKDT